jgi:hypothetical protein
MNKKLIKAFAESGLKLFGNDGNVELPWEDYTKASV